MMQIPLVLSFGINLSGFLYIIDLMITIFYFIDILVSFNTAYITAGELVKDRRRIAISYLKFWFWIDLITTIPYDDILDLIISTNTSSTQLIKILRVFRLVKIVRLVRALKLKNTLSFLDEILTLDKLISTILTVLRLCCLILIIGHWVACLWHFIGTLNQTNNWMIALNIQDESWTV